MIFIVKIWGEVMQMEELLPIVGKLAQKYTAGESTSVTYEKAQQLMGAVLYCIHEAEGDNQNAPAEKQDMQTEEMDETGVVERKEQGVSIEEMYETGVAKVVEKTKRALALYNEMLPEFDAYENRCLHDTFVKELPEFFKWYDAKFEPQNTVVMLDYPVREDLSDLEGIDKIEAYINCLNREQKFLSMFPRKEVIAILRNYSSEYRDMVENLGSIVQAAAPPPESP